MADGQVNDPGALVFEAPVEETLRIEEKGELIWEGTRKEFVQLYDRIITAKPTKANQYGKVCSAGFVPGAEYLIVRVDV